jgi:hypothetical protein
MICGWEMPLLQREAGFLLKDFFLKSCFGDFPSVFKGGDKHGGNL